MAAKSIRRHKPGDLAQLAFDEGGHILRGMVVAAAKTEGGTGLRLLSIPGYDGRLARIPTRRLAAADPFELVQVDSLNLTATTPADAQRLLVALTLAVRNAELIHEPPDEAILRDQALLADALGNWAGSGSELVLACAEAAAQDSVGEDRLLTPAQLAAESFPSTPDPVVPELAAQPDRAEHVVFRSQSRRRP